MKKLAWGLVSLAVLVVAAPWGAGQLARHRMDDGIDKLLTQMPYLRVVDRHWTGGWLHSQQDLTVEVALPGIGVLLPVVGNSRDKPLRFKVRNEILHGPLLGTTGFGLARVDTRPVLGESAQQAVVDIFGANAMRLRTRLGFAGGGTISFSADARTVPLSRLAKSQVKGTLSWDAFELNVAFSRNVDAIDFKGRVPRIELTGASRGEQVLVSGITADGSARRIAGELFGGNARFAISKVKIAAAGKSALEMDQILYSTSTKEAGNYLDASLQIGTGAIRGDTMKAAGIELTALHYDFTLRHLHIETLQKMTQTFRSAYQWESSTPRQQPETMLAPLREQALALLQHAPEFVLDRISVETPQGDGQIKGSVKLEGLTNQDVAAGIGGILPRIVVDLRIDVARGLVEKYTDAATLLRSGIEGGYLQLAGDRYASHIEYRAGVMKVNGKSLEQPIPGMGTPTPVPLPEPEPAPQLPK